MTIDQKILLEEVEALWKKKVLPSTIGHYLRDKYCVKYNRLCKKFTFLDQKTLETQNLEKKINHLTEHLKNNRKDFPSRRALKRLNSKLYNLKK